VKVAFEKLAFNDTLERFADGLEQVFFETIYRSDTVTIEGLIDTGLTLTVNQPCVAGDWETMATARNDDSLGETLLRGSKERKAAIGCTDLRCNGALVEGTKQR
jgi:predicted aspartyl protease